MRSLNLFFDLLKYFVTVEDSVLGDRRKGFHLFPFYLKLYFYHRITWFTFDLRFIFIHALVLPCPAQLTFRFNLENKCRCTSMWSSYQALSCFITKHGEDCVTVTVTVLGLCDPTFWVLVFFMVLFILYYGLCSASFVLLWLLFLLS